MIPLIQCPGCQGPFHRVNYNARWHQEMCKDRCLLDYSQYHKINFDDNDISYITFNTQDFKVYVYVDYFDLKDIVHIYHKIFPRGEWTQKPVFIRPIFEIDFSKLDYYNNKWKLWKVFS